jgi:hypothetical protein
MAFITPGTAVAGDVLTAAFWNEQVRDQFVEIAPFFATFTSWTPQIDQGATTNIAKTVNYARYLKIGRFVLASAHMSITGTGTTNNAVIVTLPSGANIASTAIIALGSGRVVDQSVADYQVIAIRQSATSIVFVNAAGNTAGGVVGINPNFALASPDVITFTIMYEASS